MPGPPSARSDGGRARPEGPWGGVWPGPALLTARELGGLRSGGAIGVGAARAGVAAEAWERRGERARCVPFWPPGPDGSAGLQAVARPALLAAFWPRPGQASLRVGAVAGLLSRLPSRSIAVSRGQGPPKPHCSPPGVGLLQHGRDAGAWLWGAQAGAQSSGAVGWPSPVVSVPWPIGWLAGAGWAVQPAQLVPALSVSQAALGLL